MAFLCPMRIKRAKKLRDEEDDQSALGHKLDSPLYASLDTEFAPDCTPEHLLPGVRSNNWMPSNERLGSSSSFSSLSSSKADNNRSDSIIKNSNEHSNNWIGLSARNGALSSTSQSHNRMTNMSTMVRSSVNHCRYSSNKNYCKTPAIAMTPQSSVQSAIRYSSTDSCSLTDLVGQQLSELRLAAAVATSRQQLNSTGGENSTSNSSSSHSSITSSSGSGGSRGVRKPNPPNCISAIGENLYANQDRPYENIGFNSMPPDAFRTEKISSSDFHRQENHLSMSNKDKQNFIENCDLIRDSRTFFKLDQVYEEEENDGEEEEREEENEQTTKEEHFERKPSGHYFVLYSYVAVDENDVHVRRGDLLTVLNRDDPNWFWVLKGNGQEGFVPANFVCPLELVGSNIPKEQINQINSTPETNEFPSDSFAKNSDDNINHLYYNASAIRQMDSEKQAQHQNQQHQQSFQPHQTFTNLTHEKACSVDNLLVEQQNNEFSKLVVLFDFDSKEQDDLSVRRGEWVLARLNDKQINGWLWVYSLKSRRYGYIPKAYAAVLP